MPDIISATYARNNFFQIIDEIITTQQPKIIIRRSKPEAVLIPYAQYQKQEVKQKKKILKNA